MPYIKKEFRGPIEEKLIPLVRRLDRMRNLGMIDEKDLTACLTYIVFRLIRRYYETGKWYDKMDAEKVCASAVDEFKRRFLHPYEDKKILENGDVEG